MADLKLSSVMIGTAQLQALAQFYQQVLGRQADMVDGDYVGWQVGNCFLLLGAHSDIHGRSQEPARMMLNLETPDVRGEFERIKAYAQVVKEPYDMEGGWIATVADPDGNYLQLVSPMSPA